MCKANEGKEAELSDSSVDRFIAISFFMASERPQLLAKSKRIIGWKESS